MGSLGLVVWYVPIGEYGKHVPVAQGFTTNGYPWIVDILRNEYEIRYKDITITVRVSAQFSRFMVPHGMSDC